MIIDTHAHHYPVRYLDLIEAQGDKYPVRIVRNQAGHRVRLVDQREFFTLSATILRYRCAARRYASGGDRLPGALHRPAHGVLGRARAGSRAVSGVQ